jgi:predicted DNA-binding transcriptional regulator AlpA
MHTRTYREVARAIPRSDEEPSERAARAIELIREALSLLSAIGLDLGPCQTANDRLIKLPDVERLTGLRRSAIYERIQRGAFPKSVKVGVRSATWSHAAVQAWISARVAAKTDD